jgi:uncharacterized protein YdaU (DUF1376 family)
VKTLPYFKWFPADAETDELYASLSDTELGFFHRCLNRSWINGSLPADPDELARMMRVTRAYLDRIWVRVGKSWYPSPDDTGRLVNQRQEEERASAVEKSSHMRRPGNANARKPNAEETQLRSNCVIRAYESVSDSEVVEIPTKKPKAFSEEQDESWKWFAVEFPGDVNPFVDLRLFLSIMETPEDLSELRVNLPLWKQSQKWVDGYFPSCENFLSKRIFKTKPRESPRQPPQPKATVYAPLGEY